MAPLSRCAAVGVMASALAACSGSVVNYNYVSENYSPYELSYSAGRGGMLTEVTGNPFDAPKASLDRRVTKSLEDHHFGPELPFFTEPPEGFSSTYRVVVLFNPAPNANGAKLCSHPERPQSERVEGVGLLASYCASGSRITTVAASLRDARGPDDPAFTNLMRQVSLNLFPPQSPSKNDRFEFQ